MKRTKSLLVGVAVLATLFTGCYSTPNGQVHLGVPGMKDSLPGKYNRTVDQVFNAAQEVLKTNGSLTGADMITKVVQGEVDRRSVWIKIQEAEAGPPMLTAVTVQVRTPAGLPDVAWAHELEKQIAIKLAVLPAN